MNTKLVLMTLHRITLYLAHLVHAPSIPGDKKVEHVEMQGPRDPVWGVRAVSLQNKIKLK